MTKKVLKHPVHPPYDKVFPWVAGTVFALLAILLIYANVIMESGH